MRRPILILTAQLALATCVHAQTTPLPSKRPVFEQAVDFYVGDLRSATQGRAAYTMQFARDEEVPANIAEEIIESKAGTPAGARA